MGGGGHINIFMFIDRKKNRFQKNNNCADHDYMNMPPPPPTLELSTPLFISDVILAIQNLFLSQSRAW